MELSDGLIKDIASDDEIDVMSSDDEETDTRRSKLHCSPTVAASASSSSAEAGAESEEGPDADRLGFLEGLAATSQSDASAQSNYMEQYQQMQPSGTAASGWSMESAIATTARNDGFTSSLQKKLNLQRKAMEDRAAAKQKKLLEKRLKLEAAGLAAGDEDADQDGEHGVGSDSDSDSDEDSEGDDDESEAARSRKARRAAKKQKKSDADARREMVAKPKKGRAAKLAASSSSSTTLRKQGGGVEDELADRAAEAAQLFGGLRATDAKTFEELRLSRPILRALSDMGYTRPTPIQARAIPHALAGRDVLGSAVTGSGKTAAFLLPTIERIMLHRGAAATRILVLLPTRELATQCHQVCKQICQHTHIRCALAVGGLSVKVQEVELRSRPEVVICTPGRIVDLLRNSRSVDCDDLEVLVLDEADRLLDMGFAAELEALLDMLPKQRQTMLFSATLDDRVGVLAKLSLQHAVRVSADPLFDMSERLTQEFVKVRRGGVGLEEDPEREAFVLALLRRSFKTGRAIVFCGRKRQAHRCAVLLGLCGESVTELHGDMSQRQRLESLELLRSGKARVLVATDLASRGIDVPAVETVINMDFPKDLTTYVHRVGRTARAGRKGVAVTLAGTGLGEKTLMREIVRRAGKNVLSRSVAPGAVEKCRSKISKLEPDIKSVFSMEWQEKALQIADREARRAENMIIHEAEIMSRPKRSWIQSKQERQELLEAKLSRSRKKIEALAKGGEDSKALLLGMAADGGASTRAGAGGRAGAGTGAALTAEEEEAKSNKAKKKEKWAEILAAREAFKNKAPHRMSRKKRRRQEAMKEMEEMERERQAKREEGGGTSRRGQGGGAGGSHDEEGDEDEGPRGSKKRRVERTNFDKATETGQAVYAKRAKKQLREAKAAMGVSGGAADHAMEKQRKKEHRRKARRGEDGGDSGGRGRSGVRADLVGDSGAGGSDGWYASLGRRRKAPETSSSSSKPGGDRDASQGAKLRKGGKPGRKAFKSRAKHNRRR